MLQLTLQLVRRITHILFQAQSGLIRFDLVYLCDSGGQYTDGTTDVTRTLHFGEPSEEEKNAYTRVLQGHIAIDMMQMPVLATGTNGYRLDALARQYLWEDGLDYRHGSKCSNCAPISLQADQQRSL